MSLFEFDSILRENYGVICGVDEAGRGPYAGDVFAGAVVFSDGVFIDGINDSKKLSEKKREALFDEIIAKATAFSIGRATAAEIDDVNILQATYLAMKRAIDGISVAIDLAVIDGNGIPPLSCAAQSLVKGDGISASVAAASILAKVSRDRYMVEQALLYPEYRFEKHKGYGTKLHEELIAQYGFCPIHRRSFLKKFNAK